MCRFVQSSQMTLRILITTMMKGETLQARVLRSRVMEARVLTV